MQAIRVSVPWDVSFKDLCLRRQPGGGPVQYQRHVLERVCQASGLEVARMGEAEISTLLLAWYAAARRAGEPSDAVMDELLMELSPMVQGALPYPPGHA